MSERIHSPEPARRRSRLVPFVTGTLILLGAACAWLQFFHANPAVSQTEGGPGKSPANAAANPGAKVMARVNNQNITYDEIAAQCVTLHGREVLEAAISRMMIQQECQAKGVQVTAAEVKQEVESTAKKFNLPLDTWYKMLESERGITPDQYHNDVIWPMLALKKLAGANVTITEDEMRIGFERDYGPRVKARMIVVNGNSRQAMEIHAQCMANPDDFERIAREKSSDANTRALGGVVPPIRRHGGNTNLEEAAFKLRVGEISSVLQVPNSEQWVIIKCEGRTEPVVTDVRDVWEDLLAQLKEEKVQKDVARVFQDIETKSRVDNYLTKESKGPRNQPVQQVSGQLPGGAKPNVAPAGGVRR